MLDGYGTPADDWRAGGPCFALPLARRSTLDEVTDWTLWADKTVTF
jgi:hypothetical protein